MPGPSEGHHMLSMWIWNNRRAQSPRPCAMPAVERCASAGSRAIGCSNRPSKDLDIEVFGIPQDRLLALLQTLGKVVPAGQAFPVYKLGEVDVALPRRESKTGRGHKGFSVEGDPSMPFDEAARRRDFTINAIGWDPLTGEYLDPFHGRDDLQQRILRVVDPLTFGDDSLRVLRALQFAARFELTIDPDTARICCVDRARRPARRADLGRIREVAAASRPAVDRVRARARARCHPSAVAGDGAALRLPAGSRVASGGQRLDPHADGDRQGARAECAISIGRGSPP